MDAIPCQIQTRRLLIRMYQQNDAIELDRVIKENLEHLRPWMPWIKEEPKSIEEKKKWIINSQLDWELRRNFSCGIFLNEQLIGGIGLHRRIARGGVETGYWLAQDFVGYGYMSESVKAMTNLALSFDNINHVEIHHDEMNHKSRRIPERLGFELIESRERVIQAPAETGIECIWRIKELVK